MKRDVKRWIAMLLTAALMVAGLAQNGNMVNAAGEPTVSGETVTAEAGDIVEIPFSISGNTAGLMGWKMTVAYDAKIMTPVINDNDTPDDPDDDFCAEAGANWGKGTFVDGAGVHAGDFSIMYSGVSSVKKDGPLFTVKFQIAETAAAGNYEIKLSYSPDDTFTDGDKAVALECKNAVVAVESGTPEQTPEPGTNTPEPGTNTPEPGTETPEPGSDTGIKNNFELYFGYATENWNNSDFTGKSAVKITGDGEYSLSFTAGEADTDFIVVTLDTVIAVAEMSEDLQITPTVLAVGSKEYEIGTCIDTEDENGYYRVAIRNSYADWPQGALGNVKVPVKAGDVVTIKFSVDGTGAAKQPGVNTPEPGKNTPEPGGDTPKPGTSTPSGAPVGTAAPGGTNAPQAGSSAAPGGKQQTTPELDEEETVPSAPGRVKLRKCKAKKHGKVQVKFKAVPGSDYYVVQYSRKKGFAGKKTKRVFGTSAKLSLKKNKTFFIRVRACRYGNSANDFEDVYGRWSNVKKVRTRK